MKVKRMLAALVCFCLMLTMVPTIAVSAATPTMPYRPDAAINYMKSASVSLAGSATSYDAANANLVLCDGSNIRSTATFTPSSGVLTQDYVLSFRYSSINMNHHMTYTVKLADDLTITIAKAPEQGGVKINGTACNISGVADYFNYICAYGGLTFTVHAYTPVGATTKTVDVFAGGVYIGSASGLAFTNPTIQMASVSEPWGDAVYFSAMDLYNFGTYTKPSIPSKPSDGANWITNDRTSYTMSSGNVLMNRTNGNLTVGIPQARSSATIKAPSLVLSRDYVLQFTYKAHNSAYAENVLGVKLSDDFTLKIAKNAANGGIIINDVSYGTSAVSDYSNKLDGEGGGAGIRFTLYVHSMSGVTGRKAVDVYANGTYVGSAKGLQFTNPTIFIQNVPEAWGDTVYFNNMDLYCPAGDPSLQYTVTVYRAYVPYTIEGAVGVDKNTVQAAHTTSSKTYTVNGGSVVVITQQLTSGQVGHFKYSTTDWPTIADGAVHGLGVPYLQLNNVKQDYTGDRGIILQPETKPYVTLTTEGQGTVNKSGGYWDVGQTIKATPSSGWTFKHFAVTSNGTTKYYTSNPWSYTFTYGETPTVKAVFTRDFTVTVNSATGGTATATHKKAYLASTTVTATPSAGYKFVGWQKAGTSGYVSTSQSYTFQVTGDVTLTPVFAGNVTISWDQSAGGSKTSDKTLPGTYAPGTKITVTATPITGYKFAYWRTDKLGTVSTNATYTFTVGTENDRLVAVFDGNVSITMNKNFDAAGTIKASSSLTGLKPGAKVTFTVEKVNAGYKFLGWYSAGTLLSESTTYEHTVGSSNVSVSAYFAGNVNFKWTQSAGGSVQQTTSWTQTTLDGDHAYVGLKPGDKVTLVAASNSGYVFLGWYKDGSTTPYTTNATLTYTVGTAAVRFVAKFQKYYTLTIQNANVDYKISGAYGVDANTVYSGDNDWVADTFTILAGTDVTITEILPDAGWIGRFTDTNNVQLQYNNAVYTINDFGADQTIRLHAHQRPNVTVTVEGEGAVTPASGYWDIGTTVTVTPATGWVFSHYEVKVGSGATNTYTDGSWTSTLENFTTVAVKAVFERRYTVTMETAIGGTAIGGATGLLYGTELTFTATADEGYEFAYWLIGKRTYDEAEMLWTVNRDITVKPVFRPIEAEDYTVIFRSVDGRVCSTIKARDLLSGAELPAVPTRFGYTDGAWDFEPADGITSDMDVYPTYVKELRIFTVTVVNGTADATEVEYETKVNLVPTIDNFAAWVDEDGNVLSTDAEYTFFATRNITISAVSSLDNMAEYSVTVNPTTYNTSVSDTKYNFSIVAQTSFGEDARLIECGILYTTSTATEDTLVIGGANVKKKISEKIDKGQFIYTLKNAPKSKTITARAYMVIEKDGEMITVYSNLCNASWSE